MKGGHRTSFYYGARVIHKEWRLQQQQQLNGGYSASIIPAISVA
jgi:hypothetical protein